VAGTDGQAQVGRAIALAAPYEVLGVPWPDVAKAGIRVLVVVVAAVVTVRLARRAVPRTVARLADASRRDDVRWEQRTRTLSGTLVSVVGVVVWTTAFVTVIGQLGFNLGPLLAGAGVVGLAVGFGAQQLVRDVISGFFVLVEDQFGVGDTVTLGGVTGTVESMTLRLTRLRADDGVLHHLRNGDLGIVSNASRGYGVATVAVPVPADVPLEGVLARINAAMAALPGDAELGALLLAEPQVLGVTGFRDPAGTPLVTVNVRVRPEAKARVQRELLQRALAVVPEPPVRTPRRRS
jgi:small-conductance mechanosensitive channel